MEVDITFDPLKDAVNRVLPTPEEEAEIQRGITMDPDTYELSDEELARMKPFVLRAKESLD